jgi:hypothetical protein
MASIIDIEKGRDLEVIEGLPTLSHFICEDHDAQIFRQFTQLGARNLLYLQGKLLELEAQLEQTDKEDFRDAVGNLNVRQVARGISLPTGKHANLQEEIKRVLRDYRKAES